MAARIKTDDEVIVVGGKDRGKRGKVLRVEPKRNRVYVEGLNMVKRHQRQTASQDGGIVPKEAPIQLSNIALADTKDGTPTRVGFKFVGTGDQPCLIFMVGARAHQGEIVYTRSEAALRHGAGLEADTVPPENPYRGFPDWRAGPPATSTAFRSPEDSSRRGHGMPLPRPHTRTPSPTSTSWRARERATVARLVSNVPAVDCGRSSTCRSA